MGLTDAPAPSNSIEHLQLVLAQVQNLCVRAAEDGNPNKHQQIRVTHWVRKLRSQPTSNPTWLKSVLEYANALLQMLVEGVVEEPFTKMPPQGPLAALPRYQVAHIAKTSKQLSRASAGRARSTQQSRGTRLNSARERVHNSKNLEEDRHVVAVVRKASKQIQTQEQDDQWEWQRVWKGAFDKMHQQLQQKTEETEMLATENKEMRALVAGYQKALEEAERKQHDVASKHLAEIENLRAVHSLELSDLQARHRQKLQEVTLQNDEKLLRRRRESLVVRPTAPHNDGSAASDSSADFLQYIDAFYSATLHLTAQNKV